MTEADLDELADRIVKMLTTTDFYDGMGNGVSELGKNFGYLAYGFIDTDSRSSRSREKERVIKAIHRGIVSRDKIIEAVTRIFDIFNRNVSEAKKETIYNKIAGGLVGSFIISQVVMRASKKIGNMKKMFTGIIYYGLMAGGMMDRSIYRSRSLKEQNPEVYSELRKDDLDLLFFLFEEQVEPLTEAIKMKRTYGIGMFNKLIDKVESRI